MKTKYLLNVEFPRLFLTFKGFHLRNSFPPSPSLDRFRISTTPLVIQETVIQ